MTAEPTVDPLDANDIVDAIVAICDTYPNRCDPPGSAYSDTSGHLDIIGKLATVKGWALPADLTGVANDPAIDATLLGWPVTDEAKVVLNAASRIARGTNGPVRWSTVGPALRAKFPAGAPVSTGNLLLPRHEPAPYVRRTPERITALRHDGTARSVANIEAAWPGKFIEWSQHPAGSFNLAKYDCGDNPPLLSAGDWVVDINGSLKIVDDDDFSATFAPATRVVPADLLEALVEAVSTRSSESDEQVVRAALNLALATLR